VYIPCEYVVGWVDTVDMLFYDTCICCKVALLFMVLFFSYDSFWEHEK